MRWQWCITPQCITYYCMYQHPHALTMVYHITMYYLLLHVSTSTCIDNGVSHHNVLLIIACINIHMHWQWCITPQYVTYYCMYPHPHALTMVYHTTMYYLLLHVSTSTCIDNGVSHHNVLLIIACIHIHMHWQWCITPQCITYYCMYKHPHALTMVYHTTICYLLLHVSTSTCVDNGVSHHNVLLIIACIHIHMHWQCCITQQCITYYCMYPHPHALTMVYHTTMYYLLLHVSTSTCIDNGVSHPNVLLIIACIHIHMPYNGEYIIIYNPTLLAYSTPYSTCCV